MPKKHIKIVYTRTEPCLRFDFEVELLEASLEIEWVAE